MSHSHNYSSSISPVGWIGVAVLHIFLGWALIVGTDLPVFKVLQKPIEAVLIKDVAVLPPSPAPKVKAQRAFVPLPVIAPPDRDVAMSITATAQPVPETFSPAQPATSATPTPAPSLPEKVEAALICPGQVRPVIPRQAYIDNIQGLVQAQATVQDGLVKDVRILSGPRVFHDAVKSAMRQYHCSNQPIAVVAMQSFNFRFE